MGTLMSFSAYAAQIGVNASSVSRAVAKGRLPVVQLADGRRLIDPAAANTARRKNSNIHSGHGGKPDRTLRRASEWKARQADGFDPAVRACVCVMRSDWPDLVRKAMAVLGADELNQARAVLAVRELTDTLACAAHYDLNAGGVWDFREALTPIPAMTWSAPDVQTFFERAGGRAETEQGLWTSDDEAGLPGGDEWAFEACSAHDAVRAGR